MEQRLGREPTVTELSLFLEIDEDRAKELVLELKKDYEDENRGLRIDFLGNRFKLTTKSEHRDYYTKLIENPITNKLSQAALETLAIIAYNEPITRMQVEALRGVGCVQIIRKLVAKGLITQDEALRNSNESNELEKIFRGVYQGTRAFYE